MRNPVTSVLVTGGAGFVGATVARRLRREGLNVKVLDDLSRGRPDRLDGWDVEIVVGDVRSARSAREAVTGVDAVVHLAWTAPVGGAHPERVAHDVNVTGTLNMLAAAREAGVGRFIYGSSAAVYGGMKPYLLHEDVALQAQSMEGAQKIAAESYVRLFGLRDGPQTTILRMFSVYGPEQEEGLVARLVGAAMAGEPPIIHGDGMQTRDLVFVDDVAVAVAQALRSPGAAGRVLNVASGEAVAVRTVAGLISDLCGGTPPPRYLPSPAGEARDVRASVAAVAATLGFRARVKLRDGLSACLGLAEVSAPAPRAMVAPAVVAAPAQPPKPPLRAFPEGSDTRLPAAPPALPPPPPAAPALFDTRPASWNISDEEISFELADESSREWRA